MNINATLLGEIITFAILIWVTAKYIWPPVVNALDERGKRIADGLAAAQRGVESQALAQKQAEEQILNAKKEAAEILASAQKRVAQFEQDERERARLMVAKVLSEAQGSIEAEVQKARDLLREQVAVLAISGAERILRREIDQAKHSELLNQLKTEL